MLSFIACFYNARVPDDVVLAFEEVLEKWRAWETFGGVRRRETACVGRGRHVLAWGSVRGAWEMCVCVKETTLPFDLPPRKLSNTASWICVVFLDNTAASRGVAGSAAACRDRVWFRRH
ncbi:hypothetical protein E2C01_072133 [Portunus trituberculatus]|uniref:Uncharacterized protein n=1 Tax=Portunus trituberculatus TaxID=210409 RepID=A0A5B7IAA6_PORTR|nr:hypothetical protein [Portunus trituberculatus]